MMLKKIWLKLFNRAQYLSYKNSKNEEGKRKIYQTKVKKILDSYDEILSKKKEINFLHSGHLGDIIYSLPVIKDVDLVSESPTDILILFTK